jgi:hypothetical protein
MFALAYVSRATQEFDDAALVELARKASDVNRQLRVTGYLNYKRGEFFQYLEGARTHVLDLMDKIAADERHEVVNVVHLGEIESRRFSDWNMRYITASELGMIQLEDVLQGVLKTMHEKNFAAPVAQETVLRLVGKLAEARGRLPKASVA